LNPERADPFFCGNFPVRFVGSFDPIIKLIGALIGHPQLPMPFATLVPFKSVEIDAAGRYLFCLLAIFTFLAAKKGPP
jgi:hypothetical protein